MITQESLKLQDIRLFGLVLSNDNHFYADEVFHLIYYNKFRIVHSIYLVIIGTYFQINDCVYPWMNILYQMAV